jgi:hypothetical protein
MLRMIFGLLIGAGLVMALVSGGDLLPQSANAQEVQASPNITGQEMIGPIREAMISPLQKTVNESSSTASGQFLKKLVDAYGLDKLPQADQQGAELVDIVPDFKSINEKAITMPLTEAGKNIRDKEIAAFYYDFLKRSGYNVTQNIGEIP